MNFYLVGSGNMAWFLTKKLTEAGHICKGIYSRNQQTLAGLTTAFHVPMLLSLEYLKDDADCCILAVSDQSIKEIVQRISFQHTVLLHTSGATDIEQLKPAAMHYGMFWLIYSIVKQDLPQHRNIPCAYEASSAESGEVLMQIISAITDIAHQANGAQRQWLHLGAVFSNNFTNHLMAIAEQLCIKQDLPFSLLQPIIQQTCERITNASPHELQTGPARRNDQNTINKHLTLLQNSPDWKAIYEVVNQSIKAMYNKDNQQSA